MSAPRVALFVTCLVDLMRPRIGFAALRALADAGCEVVVPEAQTCCGQPALNSGDRATAVDFAKRNIALLEGHDHVVVPSGSCAGTIRVDYPEILADDPAWLPRAKALAARTWEIMAYLDEVRGWRPSDAALNATAVYHDSCSGLRELGIKDQPRRLLSSVKGLQLSEMADAEVCCGFGGTFAVKYPDISNAIVEKKTANTAAVEPDLLLAGDLGCLMNIAGKLKREGRNIAVRHVAEVLAGETSHPPIAGTK